ncbi:helix-turn-helix transcriptional regulator [Amycolatopsis sp. NPDC049868]|uniref:helix-turn-helix transcriptional regulator n=1 Tax=Amycolatopsis sp. NPDC049868 TaxID=3363934 RepID=UPI00378A8B41
MGIRSSRMIGRDAELAELSGALDRAIAGRGGAIFLVGEGGIGKSRLAIEAASRAVAADIPVLQGRASSIGPLVPFRPLTQALLSHFRGGGPPEAAELDPFIPVLAQLIPDWSRGDRPRESGSLMVLAEAVFRLLAVTSRDRGALLVLDDLQDADAETLFILEYLVDNLPSAHTLFVGTLRNEPSDALRLATSGAQRMSCAVVELGRLGLADTHALAAACLETEPGRLPSAATELLWRNSAGLPFIVEELLHGMVNDGLLVEGRDGWRVIGELRARVPAALVTSIGVRMEQLGEQAGELLSVAAIIGRRFPLTVVQTVTGTNDRTLHNHLGAAVSANLVTTDEMTPGWYAFRHPLTAEALLARQSPARKAELARQTADAVEKLYPGLPGDLCALVASLRLTALDERAAGRLFAETGRRALDAGAADSAVTMLTKALDLLAGADAGDRAEVLETLVHALGQTGQFDRAVELTAAFGEVGTLERAAKLRTQLAWAAYIAGRHDECLGQIERARAPLGSAISPAQQAALDAVEANLWLDVPGRTGTAERLARQAWKVAEATAQPFVVCQALQVLGMLALSRDLTESEHYMQLARRTAEDNHLHHLRTQALVRLGGHRVLMNGDEQTLLLARADAQRTGSITLHCAVDSVRTMHAILRCDFSTAHTLLAENLAVLGRLRLTALLQYAHMTRAMSAGHRADRPAMEQALDDFRESGGENAQEMVLSIGLARVFCSLLEEDFDRARRELGQVVELEDQRPSRFHLAGQHGLRTLVDALGGVPCPEDGSAVSGMRWNRQFVEFAHAVEHGRRGDAAEAERAVLSALNTSAPYPLARHLGLRLIAEPAAADGWGDPAGWLKEAEEYFHGRDIQAVAAACRSLLRKLGAPVRQRRSGVDRVPGDLRASGVTVREYEVLVLLAERMGNKDIGARLHISPRTVEKHVASLLAKTGLADRAALAEHAAGPRPGML